jgi:hypothetical protein
MIYLSLYLANLLHSYHVISILSTYPYIRLFDVNNIHQSLSILVWFLFSLKTITHGSEPNPI